MSKHLKYINEFNYKEGMLVNNRNWGVIKPTLMIEISNRVNGSDEGEALYREANIREENQLDKKWIKKNLQEKK